MLRIGKQEQGAKYSNISAEIAVGLLFIPRVKGGERVKILIGLGMAGICGPLGWWAFNKAVTGEDIYNWIWVPAMLIAAFGVVIVIARIGLWMRSYIAPTSARPAANG